MFVRKRPHFSYFPCTIEESLIMCLVSFSEVQGFGNSIQINEKCLELQKIKRDGTSKMKVSTSSFSSKIKGVFLPRKDHTQIYLNTTLVFVCSFY